MKRKQISLIEDDVDGVTVVVAAPDQELLTKDVTSLWEAFCAYPNRNYPQPTAPSLAEFNEEGELDCTFDISYPISVTRDVVEDWLSENAKISEHGAKHATYSFW